jgi:hypothetical protein
MVKRDKLIHFYNEEEEMFYSVTNDRLISRPNVYDGKFSMYINFKMEQEISEHERSVMTILDALSQIGGVYGIFEPCLVVIVAYFVDKLYTYSILSKCYQIEYTDSCKNNDVGEHSEEYKGYKDIGKEKSPRNSPQNENHSQIINDSDSENSGRK